MTESSFDGVLLDVHDFLDTPARPSSAGAAKTVVIAGYINARKRVIEIIHALSEITRADKQAVELRLVGRIDPTYRPAINAALVNSESETFSAVISDKRVSDSRLWSELENADIVSALYSDHYGSSGMVVNAMALGRPVIFFPIGALEGFATQLPSALQPRTPQDITDCIRAALAEPQRFVLSETDRAEFIAARSPARFAEAFNAALERKG